MISYWEQKSFTSYDHIVTGAGIAGLSVAIELAEKYPESKILVLERGLFPTGASTRNAGFACMGSPTELWSDLQAMEENEVVQLFLKRRNGLRILRDRLGDAAIGFRKNGSHELLNEDNIEILDHLYELNALLHPALGKNSFREATAKLDDFGFSKKEVKGLVENVCEGELDTGMMMRALMQLAMSKRIEIKTGANVIRFEEYADHIRVHVQDGIRNETLIFRSATLSLCTNAFTPSLLPGEEIQPGRGQVIITQPVKNLKLKGIFHFDSGYYYFREIDGRVLFGGGRNTDIERETTTILELNEYIQQDLEQKLRKIILPYVQELEIAHRWSGIMAFGKDKQPIVKQVSNRIFGAYKMGGMGVALGSDVARELVMMI
ncbi:MAG TPA: FAD-dependent oxidoreductase [Flavipsychrobacter sp.]|nr:FAD-dependent oxidoreductase [Flavipsychrobacter sp.]